VARELKAAGWSNARALIGGWDAWKQATLPVQPRKENLITLAKPTSTGKPPYA
jgi:3-mercaptopyruvate sulfurtransferase SseA